MWRYTLFGSAVLAVSNRKDLNSSSAIVPSSSSTSQRASSSTTLSYPSPITVTLSDYHDGSSTTRSLSSQSSSRFSSNVSPSISSVLPPSLDTTTTNVTKSSSTISRSLVSTFVPTGVSSSLLNSTSSASRSPQGSNSSAVQTGPCTGCVLQAYDPITTFFDENDKYNSWTSVVVTETIVTQIITYFDGTTIDTIVTEQQTVNQTKAVTGRFNETITHTTPNFVIEPTPGVYLTVDAGPTYVIYDDLGGGLDVAVDSTYDIMHYTLRTCLPTVTKLKNWEPTATKDWNYFIQTYTGTPPDSTRQGPRPLPSKLVQFLKQDADIVSQFSGSDIATCTQRQGHGTELTILPPRPKPPKPPYRTEVPPPPFASRTSAVAFPTPNPETSWHPTVTGTFISTTYESTSTHVSRQGCLRCHNTDNPNNQIGPAPSDNPITDKINDPGPAPTDIPDNPDNPNDKPKQNETPDDPNNQDDQPSPGQSVTIGSSVFPINTGHPAPNPDQTNEPDQDPPVVIIGTETFTPGETKTINGVPVVAPTGGGGTRLIVDGSTVVINPAGPTGAPILMVESKPITADPQGQFIIGTQTLTPGGPAITVNGNTYSLGPSGTVAIVNGVTKTLANAPAPTQAPILTVNGQPVAPTVLSGSTLFVVGPGQTLTPGGVLTISGTTYSMPASASGSVVVINGVTSTLAKGPAITAAPALTIDGKTISAIVKDGTTQYVLAPGTTLKPGDAVTVSGTTYSLDPKGTALIINGQTSSIPRVPASNSANTTVSRTSSLTSNTRDAGDHIASGIGESKSSKGDGVSSHRGGLDKWVEGLVIGAAGWLLLWL